MDPQMVWDAMDEEELKCDSHKSMSQKAETKKEEASTKKVARPTLGWMGFSAYGHAR